MAKRKPSNKYYFSVEGETEQWYLKWLQLFPKVSPETSRYVRAAVPQGI